MAVLDFINDEIGFRETQGRREQSFYQKSQRGQRFSMIRITVAVEGENALMCLHRYISSG